MREYKYTAKCSALYQSSIMVPDDYTEEDALEYLKNNIGDTPIGRLQYIPHTDQIIKDLSGFAREKAQTVKWSESEERPEDHKPIFLKEEEEKRDCNQVILGIAE